MLYVEQLHIKGMFHIMQYHAPYNLTIAFLQELCSSVDCVSSIAGPVTPSMSLACCSHFQEGICDSPPIKTLPPMEEGACQRKCRGEDRCLFYSSSDTSCLLHTSCSQRQLCQGCRSGPKRPPLDKLSPDCTNAMLFPWGVKPFLNDQGVCFIVFIFIRHARITQIHIKQSAPSRQIHVNVVVSSKM